MYFQSSPRKCFCDLEPRYMLPAILLNIKLEQLQITDLKQSRDFSKSMNNYKVNFTTITVVKLSFLKSEIFTAISTAIVCLFIEYQTGAIAGHCFQAITRP